VIDQMRRRFTSLVQPAASDICYATRNRQGAVDWLARNVDVVLVLGDRTSSNSRGLREAAGALGTPAYLIDNMAGLEDSWLADAEVVGVTSGASTPEAVVAEVVDHLCRGGAALQEKVFLDERVSFALPPEVASAQELRRTSPNPSFRSQGKSADLDRTDKSKRLHVWKAPPTTAGSTIRWQDKEIVR
jgi:4-hydroxy-3-methylbut-2-enyl diphosphate reductase